MAIDVVAVLLDSTTAQHHVVYLRDGRILKVNHSTGSVIHATAIREEQIAEKLGQGRAG